jgi:hypothetical protein
MRNSAIDRWWEKVALVTTIAVVGVASLAPRLEPWPSLSSADLAGKRCVALQGTAQDKLPRCATVAMAAADRGGE